MKNNMSCLIFDFDGVIANTDLARFKIIKDILNEYNCVFTKDISEKDIIGLSSRKFLKEFCKGLNQSDIEEIIRKRHIIFLSNLEKYCIPYENMKETLEYFRKRFELAIVTTNSLEIVNTQLEYLGIKKYFNWIVGREKSENSELLKSYQLIPKILRKKISECIVIEDSDIGIEAAHKEGYYCIRFDPENIFETTFENEKVKSYMELKERIDKITTRQQKI